MSEPPAKAADQDNPAPGPVAPGEAWALLDVLHGSWKSQALCVAARLALADLLGNGPQSVDWLACHSTPPCHPASLKQLLEALCALGVLRQEPDGRYAVTARGALLRTGAPGSLRHWVIWWGQELWPVWGHLWHSVTTGQSARALLKGTRGFEHLSDPALAETFARAMAELTALTVRAVVDAHDFGRYECVVDIGGGRGELLAAILARWARPRGVLLDLDHVVGQANAALGIAGVADRVACVAGDFFESVPAVRAAGAVAFMCKSVIHDWTDADAVRILRTCRRAMNADRGDRLLLIEQVLPDERTTSAVHQSLSRSDLTMLVAHGAGERTQAQFRALLQDAGLAAARITPAGPTFSVIEGVPVS